MTQRIRIGELLLKAGAVDDLQLRSALNEQRKWGGQLGKVLVDLGYIDEPTLIRALSKQLGMRPAQLSDVHVPSDILRRLDGHQAREKGFCPERHDAGRRVLTVAMLDPSDVGTIDDLAFRTGCRIEPTIAGSTQLSRAIDLLFFGRTDDVIELEERSFASMGGTEHGPFTEFDASQLGETGPAAPARSPPPSWTGGERFGPIERPAPLAPVPERAAPSAPALWGEPSSPGGEPEGVGAKLEAAQKRQNRAIRVMLDLLIERGVFTEDEFRARLGTARARARR